MFAKGDKVVCVDANDLKYEGLLTEGRIYTVAKWLPHSAMPEYTSLVWGKVDFIWLDEHPARDPQHINFFAAIRFRKLVKDEDNKEVTEEFLNLLKIKEPV